jgi:ferredoxin
VSRPRVRIDGDACVGSGTCEALAPDVFAVGDDGVAYLVAEPDAAVAREAAERCPSAAIFVVDEA